MVEPLIYFGAVNLLALAAAMATGYMGEKMFMAHFVLGFLGALAATLWIGVAMFYLIYAGQAVNRAREVGLATEEDVRYQVEAKKKLFPWLMAAILSLIAGPFLGALSQAQGSSVIAHHAVGWISLALFVFCVFRGAEKLRQTGRTIEKITGAVEEIRKRKAAAKPNEPSAPSS